MAHTNPLRGALLNDAASPALQRISSPQGYPTVELTLVAEMRAETLRAGFDPYTPTDFFFKQFQIKPETGIGSTAIISRFVAALSDPERVRRPVENS